MRIPMLLMILTAQPRRHQRNDEHFIKLWMQIENWRNDGILKRFRTSSIKKKKMKRKSRIQISWALWNATFIRTYCWVTKVTLRFVISAKQGPGVQGFRSLMRLDVYENSRGCLASSTPTHPPIIQSYSLTWVDSRQSSNSTNPFEGTVESAWIIISVCRSLEPPGDSQ